MRYLFAVLVAALLATGTASAGWAWTPLTFVRLPANDTYYTGSSGARCIVGIEGSSGDRFNVKPCV